MTQIDKKTEVELKALVAELLKAEATFAKAGENHLQMIRAFCKAGISKDSYLDTFKSLVDKKEHGPWPYKELKEGISDLGYQAAMKAGYVPAVAYNRFQAVAGKFEYDAKGFPIAEGDSFKRKSKAAGGKTNPKGDSKSKGSLTGDAPKETKQAKPEQEETSQPITVDKNTVRVVLELLGAKYASNPDAQAMILGLAELESVELVIPEPPPIKKEEEKKAA